MFIVEDGLDLHVLVAEAAQHEPQARAVLERTEDHSDMLDAIRGARRHRLGHGQVLSSWHEGRVLDRCRALFGDAVLPTRAAYLYLASGDYIRFHQDVPTCAVTAAACLAGTPPALLLLPPDGSPQSALVRRVADTPADLLADGCDRVLLTPGRLVMFPGHRLPHALAGHAGSITLATMCFAFA